jgi:hypothetical protein
MENGHVRSIVSTHAARVSGYFGRGGRRRPRSETLRAEVEPSTIRPFRIDVPEETLFRHSRVRQGTGAMGGFETFRGNPGRPGVRDKAGIPALGRTNKCDVVTVRV